MEENRVEEEDAKLLLVWGEKVRERAGRLDCGSLCDLCGTKSHAIMSGFGDGWIPLSIGSFMTSILILEPNSNFNL